MKTINYKTGKVMKTIVASLIILTSFIGVTKGEKANKVTHATDNNNKNAKEETSFKTEDWVSEMTAGWAVHIIKQSKMN